MNTKKIEIIILLQSYLYFMSIFDDVIEINNSTPDLKWESDSEKMRKSREWLVDQACNRINDLCKQNIIKYKNSGKSLPDELVFNWYNVKTDLMRYLKILDDNNTYHKENTSMDFSFDTIFNGGFGTFDGQIDRTRLRQAGVINPFVLDVKRKMADCCVKVWDVSDKNFSNKKVWKITIFIHEINKRKNHIEQ